MAYADRDDVLARAGRFAGLFTVAGKRPDESDLDRFLEDVAVVMDAEIRSRGYDPAGIHPEVRQALVDVNAWATLIRALPGASPGDDEVSELLDHAREVVEAAGFPGLGGRSNLFAALGVLEAGAGGGGTGASAGSFWDALGGPTGIGELDEVEDLEPAFRRGMTL